MDQYLENRHKDIFWNLLNNPADTGEAHKQSIQRMVNDYPQSGLLQVLLARASGQQSLGKAAVYFTPKTLHKLANYPDDLSDVTADRINTAGANGVAYQSAPKPPVQPIVTPQPELEATLQPEVESDRFTAATEVITEPETATADYGYIPHAEEKTVNEESAEAGDAPVETELPPIDNAVAETEQGQQTELPQPLDNATADYGYLPVAKELSAGESEEPVAGQPSSVEDKQPLQPVATDYDYIPHGNQDIEEQEDDSDQEHHDIEDDVYDEIVSIEDIGFEALEHERRYPTFSIPDEDLHEVDEPVGEAAPEAHTQQPDQGGATSDYASFDQKLNELRNDTTQPQAPVSEPRANDYERETSPVIPQIPPEPAAQAVTNEGSKNVSRYNDDTLPYSFMWWLDKTRKEHAVTTQPYATAAKPVTLAAKPAHAENEAVNPVINNIADELQQQYYENIFNLTSVSGIEGDDKEPEFDHTKKEDVIIERFIHNDPQIKPLAADKLDSENKAKKSSEDMGELVTETLARIYTDQMLYHKAIATYKKLILKYPEKKLYFAAQIEKLEQRTN